MSQPTRLHSRTNPLELSVNGTPVTAYAGETVAALLMTLEKRTFTKPTEYNLPRTLFCVMGVCHQCLVTINGVRDLRACMTTVESNMQIATQLPNADTFAPGIPPIKREFDQ